MRNLFWKQIQKNMIRRPIILLACAGISWAMIPWLYLAPPGFLLGKPISIYAAFCLAIGLACLSSLLLNVLEKMAGQRLWAGRLTSRAGRLVVITFVTTLIALPYALSPLAPSECAYKSIIVTIANAQGQNCSRTCTNWEAANCGGWSSCFNKDISCEGGIDQNGRKCQGCCFDCKVICEPTDNPPSISGSLTCDGWGSAGWCRSNARLLLTTSDLQGYETTISGNLNGIPFTCGPSCELDLPTGTGVASYVVTSATSGMTDAASMNWAYDPELPSVGLEANGVGGDNGWYISEVTVTAAGSDSVSGIVGLLLSADGGAWQPAAGLGDGVHTVDVSAQDQAGNVATASAIVSVDTITPNLSLALTGTPGSNGWYTTPVQLTAIAGDDGSGLAGLLVSIDGADYVAYAAPVSLMEGYHTYQFLARDNAGNLTETPLQSLSVDAAGPAIHLPASWQLGQTVNYNVQENSSELAVLRVVIEDEDERWPKVTWNENVSGNSFNGEIDWNGKFKDGTTAPPGEYYATVKVSDAAGNESWKTGKIIVPDNGLMQIFSRPASAEPETPAAPPEALPVQSNPSALTFGGAINPYTPTALTHPIPVHSSAGGGHLPLPWAPIAAAAALGASAAYVEGQRKADPHSKAYRQIAKLYQQAMAEKERREQAERELALAEQEGLAAQEAFRKEDKARTALGYAWLRAQAAQKEAVLQSVASKVMPAPAPIQGDPPPPPTAWDKIKGAVSKSIAKVVNTIVQVGKAVVKDAIQVFTTAKNTISQAVQTLSQPPKPRQSVPAPDVKALYTQAAQTLIPQFTQTARAMVTPTSTPPLTSPPTTMPASTPTANPWPVAYVINGQGANFRSSPSTKADTYGELGCGETIYLGAEQITADGYIWRKVQFEEQEGWIVEKYLDDQRPVCPNFAAKGAKYPGAGETVQLTSMPFNYVLGSNGNDYWWGFGKTSFAIANCDLYNRTTGMHPGIDASLPFNTPLIWAGNVLGKVVSIDNKEINYGAGPNNFVIRAGGFDFIFGHTSDDPPASLVKLGDIVAAGEVFAYSGYMPKLQNDGTIVKDYHLHLEIRPAPSPSDTKSLYVINPLSFMSPQLQAEWIQLAQGDYTGNDNPLSMGYYENQVVICK